LGTRTVDILTEYPTLIFIKVMRNQNNDSEKKRVKPYGYKKRLIILIVFTVAVGVFASLFIPLYLGFENDLTNIEGTLENFQADTRYRPYIIFLTDDPVEYQILSIWIRGFDRRAFEERVDAGDEVKFIVGPYSSSRNRRLVYSVEVNGQVFLSLEESRSLVYQNNMVLYIIVACFGVGVLLFWGYFTFTMIRGQCPETAKRLAGLQGREIISRKPPSQRISELVERYERYENNPEAKISEYLSYDDFVHVFENKTLWPFVFMHDKICFVISNNEDMGCEITYINEGEDEGLNKKELKKLFDDNAIMYDTSQELFDDARIDGKQIKDIWFNLERG